MNSPTEKTIEIPEEAKALIRFLANAWSRADAWIWENASQLDAIDNYPMVQHTSNQLKLKSIGQQEYDRELVAAGVNAMLDSGQSTTTGKANEKQ